jgi:uncharacterized protein YecE (DUF72 family)
MPEAYIGTSGWTYKHWKNDWYQGVPAREWLPFMARQFPALEANGTHYRLPTKEALEKWRETTPPAFRFAMKAHRYLTHRKRLNEIEEGIQKQREPSLALGDKLAAVVWQLPPTFHCDVPRLERFLEALRAWPEPRHAIEFRHDSWFNPQIAALLAEARVANCLSDASRWPCWDAVTTDLVYVRLHGSKTTYVSAYPTEQLCRWADSVRRWLEEGRDVHVYFDNDAQGHAPHDARKLLDLLAR